MITPVAVEPGYRIARLNQQFGQFLAQIRLSGDQVGQRLAALRPLEAWGEVWQGLLRLQDETERFALDKRQALVSCVGMLTGRMS